jgi:hypothetical protein
VRPQPIAFKGPMPASRHVQTPAFGRASGQLCRSASSRKLTPGAHHRLSFLVVLSRERRAESATALARSSQVRTVMLHGIAKAVVIIGLAFIADQFVSDGRYTDATLSMLRQIEHSFR